MNRFKIEDQLTKMLKGSFLIKGIQQTLLRFTIEEQQVIITTDKKDFTVPLSEAPSFIENMMPAESEEVAVQQTKSPVMVAPSVSSHAVQISSIIMENIKMLKNDSSFIPQANAINDQVKSVIDLYKAEIDFEKTKLMATKLYS